METFNLDKNDIKRALGAWLLLFKKVELKAGDKIEMVITEENIIVNVKRS